MNKNDDQKQMWEAKLLISNSLHRTVTKQLQKPLLNCNHKVYAKREKTNHSKKIDSNLCNIKLTYDL